MVALVGGTAQAGSLADAITRHAPADVDALRAQLPGDPAIRCTLGAVYAKRNELSRAAVYLAGCEDAQLPPELGEPIAKLAIETVKKLRDSDLAVLEIVTKPAGMTAEIAALPGDQLVTPATVWIPAGSYDVVATHDGHTIKNHVAPTAHSRSVVFLDDSSAAQKPVKAGKADFTDEAEPSERHEGTPAAIKHDSLMSKKLRGVADPTTAGPQIDDPLAHVEDPPPPVPPAMRFGVRAGSGAASNSSASPVGFSAALEAHFAIGDDPKPFEIVARADLFERKAKEDFTTVIGASLGAAKVLAAPDAAWLSAGLALHAVDRSNELMTPPGAGLAADAVLELALRRLPVVVGARFEQGLTSTSDRAVLVELGCDLRLF